MTAVVCPLRRKGSLFSTQDPCDFDVCSRCIQLTSFIDEPAYGGPALPAYYRKRSKPINQHVAFVSCLCNLCSCESCAMRTAVRRFVGLKTSQDEENECKSRDGYGSFSCSGMMLNECADNSYGEQHQNAQLIIAATYQTQRFEEQRAGRIFWLTSPSSRS